MRGKRLAEAFIPFQIVMRTFDKTIPPIERILYGLTTLAMIAVITAAVIHKTGGDLAIEDRLRYGATWFFALLQLSLVIIYTVQFTRRGIVLYPTNRLKAVGFYSLGILFGLLTLAMVVLFILVLTGIWQ